MREMKHKRAHWALASCSCAILLTNLVATASRPSQDDEVRDLTRSSWKKKRAETSDASSGADRRKSPSTNQPVQTGDARYKIIRRMDTSAVSLSAEDSEIGVTVWRLRLAKTDDALEIRDLVQRTEGAPKEEWTPERVASNAALTEGQIVRLLIESLRKGFLYVINRAKYKDGVFSDPYLIFPTKRIYGGNNKVEAGRAIQIPGPDEEPFTLERGKSKEGDLQVSEELIILVTPQPLQSFLVAPSDRQKLTTQSVETLIEKYAASYEVAEKIGGAGRAITVAEKRAAKTSDDRLGAEDPYPQTIYRLATKPGESMLIRLELRVRD